MNQVQKKHLTERLERSERKHRWGLRELPKPAEPADVVKARKTIKTYEEAQNRKQEALTNKIDAAYRAAEEVIIFGEPSDALAAVKKFEAMKFTA